MLKVGITGGIGSGKTTVCRIFHLLGIPVFYADDAARWLMDHDAALIDVIKALLGPEAYAGGRLDRAVVSSFVFNDPEKLQQLNALVHPAAIRYAAEWMAAQQTPYAIKEAAIFFESGSYREMDVMIGVYAPQELRISRAMERTHATREEILSRVARQMNEEDKMQRCDFVITNDNREAIVPQVLQLHELLLGRSSR